MNKYNGVHEDTRSPEAKAKDWNFSEFSSGLGAIQFLPIDLDNIQHPAFKYIKSQGETTCGAHAISNILQVLEYQETGYKETLSATLPFLRRSGNYVGTSVFDVMETLRKYGTTYESLVPSNGLSDKDILASTIRSTDIQIGKVLASQGTFKINTFDEVIAYMENGRKNGVCAPVAILFRSTWKDYNQPVIKNTEGQSMEVSHWVTGVAYGTVDGKPGVVIADSFAQGTTKNGYRFFEQDAWGLVECVIGVTDKLNDMVPKPLVTFKTPLKYGMKNADVKQMQDFLKWAGYFPDIPTTDFYGNITRSAVKAFQVTFVPPSQMDDGNTFGNLSIKKMYELLK